MIDAVLQVWLKKSILGDAIHVNKSYEKIIQLLVCLYQAELNQKSNKVEFIMPLDHFMAAVVNYIRSTGDPKKQSESLVNIQRWSKHSPPI